MVAILKLLERSVQKSYYNQSSDFYSLQVSPRKTNFTVIMASYIIVKRKRWLTILNDGVYLVEVRLTQSQNTSIKIVPLVSCSKNISNNKIQFHFIGCETEIELILARSACFQTPENMHDMTICPLHRVSLGIGWRRSKRVCRVPAGKLSGHSEESKKNAEGDWLSRNSYWTEPLVNLFQLVQVNIIFLRL